MDMTIEQMRILEYRKERLRDTLRELELLLSGGNVSPKPWVQTKTGQYSEKRAWALVEELLAALEKYERYCNCSYNEDGNLHLAELPSRLPERSRDFFRSFLYCAVFAASAGVCHWIPDRLYGAAKGTFHDILVLAEQTKYDDKIELYFDELYSSSFAEGTFAQLDDLYEIFSGEKIETTIPEEDRQTVIRRHQGEIKELEELWAGCLDISPEDQEMADREWYDSLSSEEYEEYEEWEKEARWLEEARQAWLEEFQEKEDFCRQYLLFRKLYFEETARYNLARKVEGMLDIYLYEQGKSAFLKDDTFFYTFTLLKKLLDQAQSFGKTESGK